MKEEEEEEEDWLRPLHVAAVDIDTGRPNRWKIAPALFYFNVKLFPVESFFFFSFSFSINSVRYASGSQKNKNKPSETQTRTRSEMALPMTNKSAQRERERRKNTERELEAREQWNNGVWLQFASSSLRWGKSPEAATFTPPLHTAATVAIRFESSFLHFSFFVCLVCFVLSFFGIEWCDWTITTPTADPGK